MMRSKLVFVITQICLCACLFLSITAHAKRLALVIGNDNYTFVSKLQKAGNDATSMARELRAAGFAVQLHKDLKYRADLPPLGVPVIEHKSVVQG
jgi:Caspase domain